ncbi:MAG: CinA family nicotinamide mononucleotide deamidase-related protein [Caldilineae bacterium]|nr:MAG: CinA family nicotinamide mononucleotide deamidase-related protein [Caldilineae bacterium]
MNAEIILTGTELLLGEITDTNSVMMARMLRDIGLDLHYKTTVGDNEARITDVVRHALTRVDVVILSGGLGPTVDDVTRQAVAAATGRKLVYSQELEAQIAARFRRFGRKMGENNKRQAWIPEGAIPIENPVGTAPCFIVEMGRQAVICLPGVPRELEYQMKHAIVPYLQRKMGSTQIIKARILRTCGVGESDIDRAIDDLMRGRNPTVGLAAHLGQVDIRITAKAATEEEADALIAPLETEIRERVGDFIFGVEEETLPEVVGRLLQERGLRLALVDTVAGGLLARQLQEAGFSELLASALSFPSLESALVRLGLANTGLETKMDTVAKAIARYVSQPDVVGVSITGSPESQAGRVARVAVAHGRQATLKTYSVVYGSKAGQEWITVQAFDRIWRWLR